MLNYKPILAAAFLLVHTNCMAAGQTYFGTTDCAQWTENKLAARKAWVIGYISGVNVMWRGEGDPLKRIKSIDQLFLWIDNYCINNPLGNVKEGSDALFRELITR